MAEQKQTNKERLREITESIEQGIKELFESDKYMEYLRVMSRFHTYSRNNVMLIRMQMPGATRVAGFNKWRDQFGRHVKKGEKSIKIIAPTPYKKKIEEIKRDPDTMAPMLDKDGKAIMEEKEVSIPMFKIVSVFDVSQTDGRPLPQLASDLIGNVQNYEVFMEALRRSSPVPMEIKPIRESMDGYFDPETQSITLRDDMSEVQTVCAAIHEITHAKLHNYEKERLAVAAGDKDQEPPKPKDRYTEEVEAESVSYAVCQYYGIETSENSFGYIANWSSGKGLPELKASLDTIQKTASSLISDIDRNFLEICKERGIDLNEQKEAAPVVDSIEQFASDMYDYLDQLYQDGIMAHPYSQDSKEQTVADIAKEMHHGEFLDVRNFVVYASKLEGAPSAEPLLLRIDQLEQEREKSLEYRVHKNTLSQNEQEASYIQAYETIDGELVPREIVYAGTDERCAERLEQLQKGLISYKDVWAYGYQDAELPNQEPLSENTPAPAETADAGMNEKLYVLDDAVYLHLQTSEAGYDYTLYDKNTMKDLDGGQLDVPELPFSTACLKICEMHEVGSQSIKYAPLAMIETLQEAAFQTMQQETAQMDGEILVQAEDVAPASTSMLPDAPEQALDEYPMPDETLGVANLEACGYLDGDMLPLSREQAMELFEKELTVYAIVDGGSAEMLFDREDFDTQAPDVLFAVSREEWEASPLFHEKIMERHDHQEEREAAFLAHEGDCFAIYQVGQNDPQRLRFMNMDWLQSQGLTAERPNYDLVYTGELTTDGSTDQRLESLYEQFNLHHPADYHHPSLSVSDIVAVKQNGVVSCHYCDSVGFQEISGFLPQDNPLKNAEMAMEDDYGMIDGIINNGPKEPTVAELEKQARSGQPISLMDLADAVHREQGEKKKSVVEQLKNQPKQEHKKTAPKKSAEREL